MLDPKLKLIVDDLPATRDSVSNAGMHLSRVECAKYNPECMNLSTSIIWELFK
jgi:hypothetical protein